MERESKEARVLLFHMDKERADAVSKVCLAAGAAPVCVAEKDESVPVGVLAGLSGPEIFAAMRSVSAAADRAPETGGKAPDRGPAEEMAVFCFVREDQLDAILAGFRRAGIRIGLKAVLTPHNMLWNAGRLAGELAAERDSIGRRG